MLIILEKEASIIRMELTTPNTDWASPSRVSKLTAQNLSLRKNNDDNNNNTTLQTQLFHKLNKKTPAPYHTIRQLLYHSHLPPKSPWSHKTIKEGGGQVWCYREREECN